MLLMMMVFAGLVFTAKRYRDLPIGRALHEALIERPAAWLTPPRVRRMLMMLVLLVGVVLAWAELGPILASIEFSPILWFADLTFYVDAVLMVTIAVAAAQAKSVGRFLVAKLRSAGGGPVRRSRPRSSSPRRAKRPPPANDDAPGWATPLAA